MLTENDITNAAGRTSRDVEAVTGRKREIERQSVATDVCQDWWLAGTSFSSVAWVQWQKARVVQWQGSRAVQWQNGCLQSAIVSSQGLSACASTPSGDTKTFGATFQPLMPALHFGVQGNAVADSCQQPQRISTQ